MIEDEQVGDLWGEGGGLSSAFRESQSMARPSNSSNTLPPPTSSSSSATPTTTPVPSRMNNSNHIQVSGVSAANLSEEEQLALAMAESLASSQKDCSSRSSDNTQQQQQQQREQAKQQEINEHLRQVEQRKFNEEHQQKLRLEEEQNRLIKKRENERIALAREQSEIRATIEKRRQEEERMKRQYKQQQQQQQQQQQHDAQTYHEAQRQRHQQSPSVESMQTQFRAQRTSVVPRPSFPPFKEITELNAEEMAQTVLLRFSELKPCIDDETGMKLLYIIADICSQLDPSGQNAFDTNRVFNVAYYLAWCLAKLGATTQELVSVFDRHVVLICHTSQSFDSGKVNVDRVIRQWSIDQETTRSRTSSLTVPSMPVDSRQRAL